MLKKFKTKKVEYEYQKSRSIEIFNFFNLYQDKYGIFE